MRVGRLSVIHARPTRIIGYEAKKRATVLAARVEHKNVPQQWAATCTHVHPRALTCTHVHSRVLTCTHVYSRALTCIRMHSRAVTGIRARFSISELFWLHLHNVLPQSYGNVEFWFRVAVRIAFFPPGRTRIAFYPPVQRPYGFFRLSEVGYCYRS